MSWEDYDVADEVPQWSGAALAVAIRGVEEGLHSGIVVERGWRPRVEALPLLGTEWMCEYYLDTGSTSARSLSGVYEGFVIKTSMLARCMSSQGLVERILYPVMGKGGARTFLPLPGNDRIRQATLYIAEIGAALALSRGEARLPSHLDGEPRVIVRHGSLLQRLEGYMNEVYDMPREAVESVLYYSGLSASTVSELVRTSTVRRNGREAVNAGVLASNILQLLKESIGGGVSVVGVTEDVSRGRHLVAESLLRLAYTASQGDYDLYGTVKSGIEVLEASGPLECLDDIDPDSSPREDAFSKAGRYSQYLRSVVYKGMLKLGEELRGLNELKRAVASLSSTPEDVLVRNIYSGQVLNRFISFSSDSHYLMTYLYLYGPDEGPVASPRHSKSRLIAPLAADNLVSKGLSESLGISVDEIMDIIDGVEYRYIFPDKIPPCRVLESLSRRIGVDRRLIAEMVKVKPPVRLEYMSHDLRRDLLDTRVYAGSSITQYGTPSQLLVVDYRSRINEWDRRALQAILEAQSSRVMPYSTFIRDYRTRVRFNVGG